MKKPLQLDLIRAWLRQAMDSLRDNKPIPAFHYLTQIKEELEREKRK